MSASEGEAGEQVLSMTATSLRVLAKVGNHKVQSHRGPKVLVSYGQTTMMTMDLLWQDHLESSFESPRFSPRSDLPAAGKLSSVAGLLPSSPA